MTMASRNQSSGRVTTDRYGTFVIDPMRDSYSPALPSRREPLSVGSVSGSRSHQTPHLNCPHRNPLVDGALLTSSSAQDTALFLREAFFASHSPVLRLSCEQDSLQKCISTLAFHLQTPPTICTLKDQWQVDDDSTWLVFNTHIEAAAALATFPSHSVSDDTNSQRRGFQLLPALQSDLEPFHKLRPLTATDITGMNRATTCTLDLLPPTTHHLSLSPSPTTETYPNTPSSTASTMDSPAIIPSDHHAYMPQYQELAFGLKAHAPYTLSSNPPNPKTSFRAGDWIRNMTCIGCGNPRPYGTGPAPTVAAPSHNHQHARHPQHQHISPRFVAPHHHQMAGGEQAGAQRERPSLSRGNSPPSHPAAFHNRGGNGSVGGSAPHTPLPSQPGSPLSQSSSIGAPLPPTHMPALRAPPPSYPLLTPSGHALSAGGRVRNISMDPMAPCIMYWPDNEPLPDMGQIRPLGSAVMQYPPIVNTGNKGAAEKQPGDWVCTKCNYLNWRRRKVCQTCYPYAEGNGDSISQAVQAERIALLTNVLNQVEPLQQQPQQQQAQGPQRRMSAPIRAQNAYDFHTVPQLPPVGGRQNNTRSQSAADLRAQYQHGQFQRESSPIYQTPLYHSHPQAHQPHPLSREVSPHSRMLPALTPAAEEEDVSLLPSFLQDMIQSASPIHGSPTTSSSSAELSFDEYDSGFELSDGEPVKVYGRSHSNSGMGPSGLVNLAGIWKMDGEESKKTFGYVGQRPSASPAPVVMVGCVAELAGRMGGLDIVA